jgi:murein L,D-transpeptidase YcbB/YkuD
MVRMAGRAVALTCAVALAIASCGDDDDEVATSEPPSTTTAIEPTTAVTEPPATEPADEVADAEQRVSEAEAGVSAAQEALTSAHAAFCSAAEGYVETLDRYGRVFTDRAATVGDVRTLGGDLVEPREQVVSAADAVATAKDQLAAAQQELLDAQAALAVAVATASSLPVDTAAPATSTTTTLVPSATIERVQQAEDDLARTAGQITDETPLVDAGAAYNSAALALEVAWLRLLDDAECLTDEQQANAVEQLTAYTAALQTDLLTAGYDPGEIDGIYGPNTVAAVEQLQTDAGLPVTGLVDEATSRALKSKLDEIGEQQSMQIVALQTILTLTGFWDGPTDGQWTPELTQALMEFQTALGVEPSGVVDAATLAAFQQALADLETLLTSTTTSAPAITVAPVRPPTTQAPSSPTTPVIITSPTTTG